MMTLQLICFDEARESRINVRFSHLRRRNDNNKFSEYGGHTLLVSCDHSAPGMTFVSACSVNDKFCKRIGRWNCIQGLIEVVFGKEYFINEVKASNEKMMVHIIKVDDPKDENRWWLK